MLADLGTAASVATAVLCDGQPGVLLLSTGPSSHADCESDHVMKLLPLPYSVWPPHKRPEMMEYTPHAEASVPFVGQLDMTKPDVQATLITADV